MDIHYIHGAHRITTLNYHNRLLELQGPNKRCLAIPRKHRVEVAGFRRGTSLRPGRMKAMNL